MTMGISCSNYQARFGFDPVLTPESTAEVRKQLNDRIIPQHLAKFETALARGKTGWLAKAVDADSLAACLSQALDMTPAARQKMAAETRAHIEARFSVAQMCASTLKIYRRLLKDKYAGQREQ